MPPNVGRLLQETARRVPSKAALRFPIGTGPGGKIVYGKKTYRELEQDSDAYARGLRELGVRKGTKTILMVTSGPDLFAVMFALLKIGAVPVVVDPGMGMARMLECYRAAVCEAMIAIPLGHVVRVAYPSVFGSVKMNVTVGRRWFWRGKVLAEIARPGAEPPPFEEMSDEDLLFVLFTTGSTGPAKGVEYTHGMLETILTRTREHFELAEQDVTLSTWPLFALFDLLVGVTAVLPPMNPTRAARVDSKKILDAIDEFKITKMFASPVFFRRVGKYARDAGRRVESLDKVLLGGAPITAKDMAPFREAMAPDSKLETTYGSAETLPIATIEYRELAELERLTREGQGTCVGRPMFGIAVRIIRICDDPISEWSPGLLSDEGQVGEIVVAGSLVSRRYYQAPAADARAKIREGERLWHRTGDLGRFDESGRIWFCGRKSQRVTTALGTLFTVQWEGVFDGHPAVRRSALVGVGRAGAMEPVTCIELAQKPGRGALRRVERELRELARSQPLTEVAKVFLFHPSFPVDARHNAKIGREELAAWAAKQLAV